MDITIAEILTKTGLGTMTAVMNRVTYKSVKPVWVTHGWITKARLSPEGDCCQGTFGSSAIALDLTKGA